MRAALYHRVSTNDQNPAAARRELHAAAKRLGARVELDIEETGSGARSDRPGLLEVMEAARRGRVDVVIVWKLSRWGRGLIDLLHNIEQLELAGVALHCTSEGFRFGAGAPAAARLQLHVLGAVAEFEREVLRENTRLGLQAARDAGVALGRPRAPIIDGHELERLQARGMPIREIARELGTTKHRVVVGLAYARVRKREAENAAPAPTRTAALQRRPKRVPFSDNAGVDAVRKYNPDRILPKKGRADRRPPARRARAVRRRG